MVPTEFGTLRYRGVRLDLKCFSPDFLAQENAHIAHARSSRQQRLACSVSPPPSHPRRSVSPAASRLQRLARSVSPAHPDRPRRLARGRVLHTSHRLACSVTNTLTGGGRLPGKGKTCLAKLILRGTGWRAALQPDQPEKTWPSLATRTSRSGHRRQQAPPPRPPPTWA